eukprot:6198925-Pleurochrysis_carterae.AAC.1
MMLCATQGGWQRHGQPAMPARRADEAATATQPGPALRSTATNTSAKVLPLPTDEDWWQRLPDLLQAQVAVALESRARREARYQSRIVQLEIASSAACLILQGASGGAVVGQHTLHQDEYTNTILPCSIPSEKLKATSVHINSTAARPLVRMLLLPPSASINRPCRPAQDAPAAAACAVPGRALSPRRVSCSCLEFGLSLPLCPAHHAQAGPSHHRAYFSCGSIVSCSDATPVAHVGAHLGKSHRSLMPAPR